MTGDGPGAYPVIDVTSWGAVAPEQLGSKRKQWLADPEGVEWLFKVVRCKPDGSGVMRVFGEDWSEKLAREIGLLLRIPVPEVQLARRTTVSGATLRGALVRTFRGGHESLAHGNELLQRADPSYDRDRTREVPGYTLEAVWASLEGYGAPAGMDAVITSATDAFAGYLVFDALIANTDRNHENWAALVPVRGQARLAPSFDHATSLGFQEPPERKSRYLSAPHGAEVRRWTERGRSSHFEGKPSLVQLAMQALRLVPAEVAAYWCDNLVALVPDDWKARIDSVPPDLLSQPDRTFACEIVRVNRERLLDAC